MSSLRTICRVVQAISLGLDEDNENFHQILKNIIDHLSVEGTTAEARQTYIDSISTLQNLAKGLRHAVDPICHSRVGSREAPKSGLANQDNDIQTKLDTLVELSKAALSGNKEQTRVSNDTQTMLTWFVKNIEALKTGESWSKPETTSWMQQWKETNQELQSVKSELELKISALTAATSDRDALQKQVEELTQQLSVFHAEDVYEGSSSEVIRCDPDNQGSGKADMTAEDESLRNRMMDSSDVAATSF